VDVASEPAGTAQARRNRLDLDHRRLSRFDETDIPIGERTQLKAPIAGTVQQLAVSTVGQVVASGQSLLTIVPLDSPIEIEAMIGL
jgi:multidrug resistance efflux pump